MEQDRLRERLYQEHLDDQTGKELWRLLSLEGKEKIAQEYRDILDNWFFNSKNFYKYKYASKGLFEVLKIKEKPYMDRLKYLIQSDASDFGLYYDEVLSLTNMNLIDVMSNTKDKEFLSMLLEGYDRHKNEQFPGGSFLKSILSIWGISSYEYINRLDNFPETSKEIEEEFKQELIAIKEYVGR